MLLQLTKLQSVFGPMNDTFSELMALFGNGTSLQSGGALHAASLLFCHPDVLLNETTDRMDYFERLRENEPATFESSDNSSKYVYDNSTSKLKCAVAMQIVGRQLLQHDIIKGGGIVIVRPP